MAFPTIPTSAAGRAIGAHDLTLSSTTRTFPDLSGLTKNAGDLLIAIISGMTNASSPGGANFSSWGGGFTELADLGYNATNPNIGIAYKWSDGTETGTFTVTQAPNTGSASMILLSIAGAHASTPPAFGSIVSGTSSAANPAALNPSAWDVEDTLWISIAASFCSGAAGSYTGLSTPPTNFGNLFKLGVSVDGDAGMDLGVGFRQNAVASEDVGTWTLDLSNAWNTAVVLAVRPAAAPSASATKVKSGGTMTTFPTKVKSGGVMVASTAKVKSGGVFV